MILRQTFPKSGCLFNQILVVPGAWTCESRLQCAAVSCTVRTAKSVDQSFVNDKDFVDGWI